MALREQVVRSHRGSRIQLVLFLGLASVAAYFAGEALWFNSRFQSALRAERARDFDRAQTELNACVHHWPNDPQVHLLAARLGWRSRLEELPLVAGWESSVRAHLKRAQDDPLLIERVTQEELVIDALSGRLDVVSGALARRLKDHDADEVPILEALVWANIFMVRHSVASRAVGALIDRDPEYARAYYWRGFIRDLTQWADGRPDMDYRRAVELAPGVFQFRLGLAQALMHNLNKRPDRQQVLEEALGLFEGLAADSSAQHEVLAGLGRCRLELGDVAAALPALREAVNLAPADGDVRADLGRAMLESGNVSRAEEILRQAVALAPNRRLPNYHLGLCLRQLGRERDAKPYLDAATRIVADAEKVHELSRQIYLNPTSGPEQRFRLGELLCRTGNEKLGECWLRSAHDADPEYEPARKALAALRPSAK
jgi:tetratricopeptide (TPR) repeat protein